LSTTARSKDPRRIKWGLVSALAVTAGVSGGHWLRTGSLYLTEVIVIFVFCLILYLVGRSVVRRLSAH
jgi:hypothetical protein